MSTCVTDPRARERQDAAWISNFQAWMRASQLPETLIDRIPDLKTRRDVTTREIADELAALGYAWTANEVRDRWRA